MELSKVASMNDAAVAAFETFDQRQRYRSNTNLVRFHRELEEKYGKINRNELIETFKRLQEAGMGSLIVSRNQNNTRFAWNYSLRDVAKAAKGQLKPQELHKVGRPTLKKPRPVSEPVVVAVPKIETKTTEVLIIRHGAVQTLQLDQTKEMLFNEMIKVLQK